MNQELHNKAWNLLDEKGLTLGEKVIVRSHFESAYKDEYPFISVKYEKGEVKHYVSDIEEIKSLMFETEKEVILANAIFENIKDNFNINEFIQILKFTFRILNVSSRYTQ